MQGPYLLTRCGSLAFSRAHQEWNGSMHGWAAWRRTRASGSSAYHIPGPAGHARTCHFAWAGVERQVQACLGRLDMSGSPEHLWTARPKAMYVWTQPPSEMGRGSPETLTHIPRCISILVHTSPFPCASLDIFEVPVISGEQGQKPDISRHTNQVRDAWRHLDTHREG